VFLFCAQHVIKLRFIISFTHLRFHTRHLICMEGSVGFVGRNTIYALTLIHLNQQNFVQSLFVLFHKIHSLDSFCIKRVKQFVFVLLSIIITPLFVHCRLNCEWVGPTTFPNHMCKILYTNIKILRCFITIYNLHYVQSIFGTQIFLYIHQVYCGLHIQYPS